MPKLDDALQFLLNYLREPRSRSEGQSYGYDLYIPNVCKAFGRQVEGMGQSHYVSEQINNNLPWHRYGCLARSSPYFRGVYLVKSRYRGDYLFLQVLRTILRFP